MVLDLAGHEDDPLPEQAGIDVEAPLAAIGLLDDDGNERADDILMVHGGERFLLGG